MEVGPSKYNHYPMEPNLNSKHRNNFCLKSFAPIKINTDIVITLFIFCALAELLCLTFNHINLIQSVLLINCVVSRQECID